MSEKGNNDPERESGVVFFLSQTAPVMYQSAKELAGCAVLAPAPGGGAVLWDPHSNCSHSARDHSLSHVLWAWQQHPGGGQAGVSVTGCPPFPVTSGSRAVLLAGLQALCHPAAPRDGALSLLILPSLRRAVRLRGLSSSDTLNVLVIQNVLLDFPGPRLSLE